MCNVYKYQKNENIMDLDELRELFSDMLDGGKGSCEHH